MNTAGPDSINIRATFMSVENEDGEGSSRVNQLIDQLGTQERTESFISTLGKEVYSVAGKKHIVCNDGNPLSYNIRITPPLEKIASAHTRSAYFNGREACV